MKVERTAISFGEDVIFSMDDENIYGPTFASLNFGEAIEKGIISEEEFNERITADIRKPYIFHPDIKIKEKFDKKILSTFKIYKCDYIS